MMKFTTLVAAAFAALLLPASAGAQSQGLAAIVNDDPITVHDLRQRIKFALAILRAPDRPEFRRRLAPQVLQRLIMERLQLQEAARLKLSVSKAEIDKVISDMERNRGMPQGGLAAQIRRAGIKVKTFRDQLRAQLAWNKVIRQQISPLVQVSTTEVEEATTRTVTNKDRVRYRFREIYLPVDSADREATVLRNAQGLMEQIRRGAPFNILARQFSGSSTAAVGGDRGVVFEGQLEPALLAALKKMRPGQVAGPIRTATGYYIVQLRARGTVTQRTVSGGGFNVARVGFRYPPQNAAARARANTAIAEIHKTGTTCASLLAAGRSRKATFAHVVQNVVLRRLPPAMRRVIAPLKPGQKSQIVRTPGNAFVFMRCRGRPASLPTRAAVRRSIFLQKINVRAQNYLRDLRRAAIVEIRV